jgi:diketogulonate reductase-like aldo/keto reductase
MYGNEREVGSAIKSFLSKNPSIKREDIFYTTKLASNAGYNRSLKALEQSLQRCGLDYIDLILIHSPYGGAQARKESWNVLLEAQKQGWTKSIGVSNYGIKHLQELLDQGQKPVINQVDLHPFMTRTDIVDFCQKHEIVLEVYYPMTMLMKAYAPLTKGYRIKHPPLLEIAKKYNKSAAQVLIRWGLQHGYVEIPKSSKKQRIEENTQVWDFEIAEGDMKALDAMDEYIVTGISRHCRA